MKSFGEGFAVNVNMRDRGRNIVYNASINNNESMGGIAQRLNSHMIKLLNSGFEVVFIVFNKQMK